MKNNQTSPETCATCRAACCRYVATQIDEPDCKPDYNNVRWYLLHRDVSVFIDHSDDWYIEFATPCEALDADHRCSIYDQRPLLCRSHGSNDDDDCEHLGAESPYRRRFNSAREFEDYLSQQGLDWQP